MKFDNMLMDVVKKILETNHVPMLLGEPGIGKSSWVEELGKLMHTKVFVLACNQLADKADMTGSRLAPVGKTIVNNPDGSTTEEVDYAQKFFPHIVVKEAIEYALANPSETPILFMDELNRTTPDVTSEALSLPTLRSIGNVSLPANLRIITAGNDKGNITALDEASRTRFVLLHVAPDVETFINVNPNLNTFVQKVLSAHPETIFGRNLAATMSGGQTKDDDDDDDTTYNIEDVYMDDGEDMSQLTTPRTISSVSDWLNQCDTDELKMYLGTLVQNEDNMTVSLLQEILEGHTGKTAFTALLLAEITTGINTVNLNNTKFHVPKPRVYDQLVSQPTHDALNDFITNMSDSDKSGCLVYALSEKTDTSDIINALANCTTLTKDDTSTMVNLFSQNLITEENKQTFFDTNSLIANQWSAIFN